jgi:DNA-binding MarR family transcriptional regulator
MLKSKKPEQSLEFILNNTARILNTAISRTFVKNGFDVTVEQWTILNILWEKDGRCQYELAEASEKERPGITRIIDNMEKNNLVVRVPSENDKRHKLIFLTYKAKELKEKLNDIANITVLKAAKSISKDELNNFKEINLKIQSNLAE